MALHSGKPFYRIPILASLAASLIALTVGGLRMTAQSGNNGSSPSAAPTRREVASEIVAQENAEILPNGGASQQSVSQRQKRELMKENLERMKRDAGELAGLTKALQEEIEKGNENMLALDVVNKADKIQKLAKRIKGNAKGI